MARSHSDAPAPTSDGIHTVQLRSVVQGDLRALAIPAQAVLAFDAATPITATAEGAPLRGRLGVYLCAQGLITADDLAAALAEQRQRTAQGRPIALGDLLVEHGHLTAHELVTVLMLQQLDRRQAPTAQTSPLGHWSQVKDLRGLSRTLTQPEILAFSACVSGCRAARLSLLGRLPAHPHPRGDRLA